MAMSDFVVPVVFPDYLITVIEHPVDVKIPRILPGQDLFPDHFRIPATKLPELGHAGVLFIKGSTGTTKYYEYGRYDRANLGLVMRRPIPDVTIRSKLPTMASLLVTMRRISQQSGQFTRIEGAFIELTDGSYEKMLDYAQRRLKENTDPKREPYSLTSNSCLHFMKLTSEAGGADMPWVIDPRPIGYIERVRSSFPVLDYRPKPESLKVPVLEDKLKTLTQPQSHAATAHGRR
jgi:hypothetical protein